jgi:hypothetical protein
LSNLAVLDLDTNRLTGTLPPVLGNLSDLGFLDLAENQLTGTVPLAVARLGGLIQSEMGLRACEIQLGNENLTMPDSPEYRDADLNGDGLICGVPLTSGTPPVERQRLEPDSLIRTVENAVSHSLTPHAGR